MDSWSSAREVEKVKRPPTRIERRTMLRQEASVRINLLMREAESARMIFGPNVELARTFTDCAKLLTAMAQELEP